MAKQKIFKTLYAQRLLDNLADMKQIEKYRQSMFDYDEDEILIMPNINSVTEQNLQVMMDSKNDYESAKCLYLALKELTPIQAADPRLWTYLTHVDLYDYMIHRWNDVYTGETDDPDYIKEHWFVKNTSQQVLMRNALSGLWWAVYLSSDESRTDSFELTKVFFKDLDLPTRTIGTYRIGRHKEAVLGVLQFIKDNPDLMNTYYEKKTRHIFKHLNILGGSKPLSLFDRQFFYDECKSLTRELINLK